MIQLGSAYGEIQIGTGDAQRNVTSLADSMRRVGTTMSMAVSAPLLAVGTAGLKAAAGFEQSMAQIQVVSGATAAQMTSMQEVALQLGRDTSFSAGEAAQGLLELAKAGMSADQSMAAIGGVLDLAAAGGLSVASAAEIASNALNSFNLPASDAARVADLLAAAANSSSIEVTDMAQAFAMSSSVFSSNSQSIEDLSTAIAILGNNGLKGSDAGTSLKTMLMRLTAPTDQAASAMAALGIEVYNADGSMRSFQDVVGQLETATAGLTQEQRNQALTTIFGADAIRAANILIAEGAGEFDNMKASVEQAGAAQVVADARMRGLAGAVAYAKGTIESTLISAFLPLTTAIGDLIRKGADLVGKFGALPEPVRNAALAFGAVLAVAGPILVALPLIAGALAALLSPIGLVVLAVAGLAAAWASDWGGIREKTAAAMDVIQPWLATNLPGVLRALQTTWETVSATIQTAWGRVVDFLQPTIDRITAAFPLMIESFEPVGGKLLALWDVAGPVLMKLGTVFGVALVEAVKLFGETIALIMPHVGDVVGMVIDALILYFRAIDTALTATTTYFQENWPAIQAAVQNAVSAILGTFETIYEWLTSTLQAGVAAFQAFLGSLSLPNPFDVIRKTIAAISGAIDSAKSAMTGFVDWLGSLRVPNPFAGIHIPSVADIGNAIGALGGMITGGGKAAGTMFAPGGMTLVGERGPELVDLPQGARVYTADQTRRLGAGTGGGGDIVINLGGVTITNGMDVQELAWQLGNQIKARLG